MPLDCREMERRAAQDGEILPNIGFSNMMRNFIQDEMNKKRDLQMQADREARMALIAHANAHHTLHHTAHVHVQTEEEKQQLKGRISALLANAPPLLKPEWVQDKRKFQASQTNLNRVSQRSAKTDRTNRFPRKLTTAYYEQHLASHAVNR